MTSPTHALRAALNGTLLQLEVARIAMRRGDQALLERALDACRDATERAASLLDGRALLDAEGPR